MVTNFTKAQEWLATELAERRARNPRYSLRMLAKTLQISPGRLSEYISGKRSVSPRQALKIFDRLEYPPEMRQSLMPLFERSQTVRGTAAYTRMSADTFHVIAEGSHLAFLCLMDIPEFKSDVGWMASRLRATPTQTQAILERLVRVGLVEILHDGGWKKAEANLETSTDVHSTALRLSHKESMQQAIDALDSVALELRDITSVTMALDPARLPEAKKMIRQFRRKMCAFLEQGKPAQVYNLNVQLVPITALVQGEET